MRNTAKTVGVTIHQNLNTNQQQGSNSSKDHLGSKLLESAFIKTAKRPNSDKFPPSDFVGKCLVSILNPSIPFAIFLWFEGDAANDVCIVDVVIDGKKSRGWVLKAGRKNGVCIQDIDRKGNPHAPLEFKSKSGLGSGSGSGSAVAPIEYQGMIQATFWRVMKATEGDGSLIPDEGEKAIAILQMHYSYNPATTSAKPPVVPTKMPLQRLVSESQYLIPSTAMTSPVVDSTRIFNYGDITISSSEQDSAKKQTPSLPFKMPASRINMLDLAAESEEEQENYKTPSSFAIAPAAEDDDMQVDPLIVRAPTPAPKTKVSKSTPKQPLEISKKRNHDALSSSDAATTTTPYRKRIPMTLKSDTETTLTTLRITLDHHTTRKSLQAYIKAFLEGQYWEQEGWDSLEPEDATSITWYALDGVSREFEALDDESVWCVEGLVIQV